MEYKNRLGKPCTAAQYITDLVIKRRAEYEKKILPIDYYKIDPWNKLYKKTIIRANSLLKIYSEEAIIKALNTEGKKIYSLHANWLIDIIEKKERELLSKVKVEYNIKPTDIQPKKTYANNILGKLK